ncbi:sterol O-acyltransferase 2 [Spea bombifrons]|uniref:sterol O-acyltransferase 2 n=1 Tax=Spea bombifrons TaxID=233779 RepID=UPI00234BB89A|nr:sterol O-acyltransferase 2 [Spea bombifrons]
MTTTNDSAGDTMRQRKGKASKDQNGKGENGTAPDHINSVVEWNKHMEVVKAELVENMSSHLKTLLDKAVAEAVLSYKKENATSLPQKRDQGSGSDQKKIFLHRASLLDELMEVEHFRTIYHMFAAALCVFFISTVAVDFVDQGRLVLEFDLLFYAFGQLKTVVFSWITLFIYTLWIPYIALHFWGSSYPKSKHPFILSASVASIFIVCQICILGVLPIYIVVHYKLPPASSIIVLLEQVRFLMKTYSFLRETVPSIILKERKEDQLPKLSSYLYFLFCPTLIYRDSYPRTPYIRWKYVAKNFSQFLGCLFFTYFILVTLCIPVFTNMSKQPFRTRTLVLSIFHATLPGTFLLLITFFAFLHCWLNAFAEMLRFADRMFYKDWWNSTSFSNYYRTWNVVVHDWLYYYVYRDLLRLCNQRFRAGVMLAVFLISALVHEYVITLSLGYFYPVMFCLFAIFGVLFNFMMHDKRTSPVWNVMVWTFLFIGQGIQLCLYCQEWYAQIHCPLTEKTFWGMITPRSWTCRL